MSEEMINKTYDRFMIRQAEGRRRTIVDSYDDYIDDKNPLFGRIDGDTRCGIYQHLTYTNKSLKRGTGQRLNIFFKASARSIRRRQRMCVQNMWTKMRS